MPFNMYIDEARDAIPPETCYGRVSRAPFTQFSTVLFRLYGKLYTAYIAAVLRLYSLQGIKFSPLSFP